MLDPILIRQLAKVRNIYHARAGQWGKVSPFLRQDNALASVAFLTNLFGLEKPVYQEVLIPAYQRLKRYCGLKRPPVLVGSCDSFFELSADRTQAAFSRFVASHTQGLAVIVGEGDVRVKHYVSERCLGRGVLPTTHLPYEPVFVQVAIQQRVLLDKLEALVREDADEVRLEEFILAHYKDLFGNKYDRVETQLWLRFPDVDIGQRSRRLDVFLRNSVVNDWELFEIKRAVPVSGTYRDAPVIAREVTNAIHQAKNYLRTLMQEKVKKHFATIGINYYEPTISVVIGRSPDIPHEQWRWLRSVNEQQVKIITFDDLISELRCRLEDRYAVLDYTRRAGLWPPESSAATGSADS